MNNIFFKFATFRTIKSCSRHKFRDKKMRKLFFLLALIFCVEPFVTGQIMHSKPVWWVAHKGNILKHEIKATEKKRDKLVAKCLKKAEKKPELAGEFNFVVAELYSDKMANRELRNLPLAIDYFRKAAQLSDSAFTAHSLFNIGLLYEHDNPLQNFDSALYYFELASSYNDYYCIGLGEMYEYGLGVDKDPAVALEYYRRSIHGGANAYTRVYAMAYYLDMLSKNQLDTVAAKKYQEAVLMASLGEQINLKYHDDLAHEHYQLLLQASNRGYAPAIHEFAKMSYFEYYPGYLCLGLSSIEERLKDAMDLGYIPAIYDFGYVMEYSRYAKKETNESLAHAYPYYLQAAEAGYPLGQYSVGVCCFYGVGTQQNYALAEYWYQLAADQGYTGAKTKLKNFSIDRSRHRLDMANVRLAETFNTFSASLANASAKQQNLTSEQKNKIQNSGYTQVKNKKSGSNNDTSQSKKKSNIPDPWTLHQYQKVYDDYGSALCKMCYGLDSYSESERIKIQNRMRDIRSKCTNNGYGKIFSSEWETWNGECKYYKN